LEKLGVVFLKETFYGEEIISQIENINHTPEKIVFNHRFTRQSDGANIFTARTEWRPDEKKGILPALSAN
jgi:hypothetical protein